MKEDSLYDKKSLRAISGKSADFKEIAKDAVAFSNAQGGVIEFGIEDCASLPEAGQRVEKMLVVSLENKVRELSSGVYAVAEKRQYPNGGETILFHVKRNSNTVATTAAGQIYLRVGDRSMPVSGEDIPRLLEDKGGYSWEAQLSPYRWQDCDSAKRQRLLSAIRCSERVSPIAKQFEDKELLAKYLLIGEDSDLMTHLGVLFLGTQTQRARIPNAPTIQCIRYDELGEKTMKWLFNDYTLAPDEMLEAVWRDIPVWQESQEVSEGMFRHNIPAFDAKVVRELVCNALVHRQYTMRGDIFINIHPQRLEVVSPGRLPLGITPQNILHKSRQRNQHLANLMYVLHCMEQEGSGYDAMYESLLVQGKRPPVVVEGDDYVAARVERRICNAQTLTLMRYVDQHFQLKRKQNICLGSIAQNESLTARELTRMLELEQADDLRPWLQPLLVQGLVVSQAVRSKGKEYRVNPQLLKEGHYRGTTSLKRIEDYRLKELIIEDLKIYQEVTFADLHERIGTELSDKRIKLQLKELIEQGTIAKVGDRRWTRYRLLSPQKPLPGQ